MTSTATEPVPAETGDRLPVDAKTHFEALACPQTKQPLHREGDELVTADGRHRYPIVREIPRFVPDDLYVGSFSFEWNTHKTTQLDSHTGSGSSEDIFRQKTGLEPEDVRGKLVLDAGVGAGRFSDILCRWGAHVIGVDLSYAVEASNEHFGHLPDMLIAQADIGRLPFRDHTFDYIISIGVLHHTPDTHRYFAGLPRLLKPGGEIAIWVYPDEGDYLKRNAWIPFTSRIPPKMFYGFNRVFVPLMHRRSRRTLARYIAQAFPLSDQQLGIENDILDTFDGYSPRYHGIHSPAEVTEWFNEAGLEDIRSFAWHTAVRGRAPREAGAATDGA